MAKNLSIKLLLVVFSILASCSSTDKIAYMAKGIDDNKALTDLENTSPALKSNDLLSISVSSLNKSASEIFNIEDSSVSQFAITQGTVGQVSGYLVNNEGFIKFPILGEIKAAGITKDELSELIENLIVEKELLVQPIVDIRYLNYKVSVLGEVKNPGVYNIQNEKISFLEALALSGDLTIYGKRKDVMLIREEFGLRKTVLIDLTEKSFLKSPYYYLKTNDIIYVQPSKKKVGSVSNTPQWLSITVGALSLAVISIATFVIN
ncbi:hypothetical protein LCGC14_1696920 [marine sediment metagenome]|uniref:Uncharacterized protein n=1 Tax=marine sediment metagenome TaxID=412755 RepID=A0A0F9I6R7_9ZZZZ